MLFPPARWTINPCEDCQRQKKDLETSLLEAIRAGAFQSHPADAVERPQEQLKWLKRLVSKVMKIQVKGRDPEVTHKKHWVGDSEEPFYYIEAYPWRCFFDRDVIEKTAMGLFIAEASETDDHIQAYLDAIDRMLE